MSLTCNKIPEWMDFANVVKNKGHDFWVSCIADVSTNDFQDRIQSVRVEEMLVTDAFTHCYYRASKDIKTEADSIVDKVGLGLRKCRVRSKSVSGCVYVLVNQNGASPLSQQRAQLSPDDRKLSAEERLRRTSMQLDIVSVEHIEAEAKRHPQNFWLTAWSNCCAEEGKKKVVTTNIEGQLATQRFKRCLLADVVDCHKVTLRVASSCGLGLRKQAVRSKSESGCIALLLTGEGLPPMPIPPLPTSDQPPSRQSKTERSGSDNDAESSDSTSSSSSTGSAPRAKRARGDGDESIAAQIRNTTKDEHPAAQEQVTMKGSSESSEELYFRQVQVIEKKLMTILPTLPRDELSTPFVQAKLEISMRKPHGRLDKFKLDIARVWRAYVQT